MHYITIKNFFEQYNALFLIFLIFFYGVVKKVGSHVSATSISLHVPAPLASVLKTYVVFADVVTSNPIVDGLSPVPGVTLIPVPAV